MALDSEAKAINADTTITASEKADALSALDARWEDYVTKTHALNIYIGGETYSEWKDKGVEIKSLESNRYTVSILDYAYPIFMVVVLVVFMIMIFRSMRGGGNVANDFGKSKATVQSAHKVRFTDVAGAEEEKEELAEIVDFLKTPGKFAGVGARVPKGVLLVGPPGTGKTLFAKAVAGEANVPFFSISGSDFVEMYVGVGASRVRDLFAQAKKNQPCIIFIDEIDAVGRQRGAGLGGGHDEREQTLNQLLVQMDGFDSNETVIVMAATNRSDILDPALMRPGRFDRQIYVDVPDVRGREAIFKVHARNKPISPDIDFRVLARMTSGFTGAEIANLLNEAAILCARNSRTQIIMEDLYEAIDKVLIGPQKKSRLVTEVDKRITAYHEGGHAIVGYKLAPHCDPVQEVSIIPRGMAAGYTLSRPDNDDDHITYKKLTADIAMTMGGRAAEEVVIQDISAGASGDIRQATSMAKRMVTEWGMSEVGPIYLGGDKEVFLGRDYGSSHSYSDSTAAKIDEQVHKIVEDGHQLAVKIVRENRALLDTLVRVLIERETIYAEEFDLIMKGTSAEEVIKLIDERTYRNFGAKHKKESEKLGLGDDSQPFA
ncbi:MAG: ATP-dependent zinc metalloprotease FtsH [Clostridia bacterium]|nr:ATP-dependent zinc metalloprotease FtsH [Clostridia bacterium]